jgi:hypothetical protein
MGFAMALRWRIEESKSKSLQKVFLETCVRILEVGVQNTFLPDV